MLAIYLALFDNHFELTICHYSVFPSVFRKLIFKISPHCKEILHNLLSHIYLYLLYMHFSLFCFINSLLLNFIVYIFARGFMFFLGLVMKFVHPCRQKNKINLNDSWGANFLIYWKGRWYILTTENFTLRVIVIMTSIVNII